MLPMSPSLCRWCPTLTNTEFFLEWLGVPWNWHVLLSRLCHWLLILAIETFKWTHHCWSVSVKKGVGLEVYECYELRTWNAFHGSRRQASNTLRSLLISDRPIDIIIIFYFENVTHFFHAKLGSDVCHRVDNQTSVDTLSDLTRSLVGIAISQLSTHGYMSEILVPLADCPSSFLVNYFIYVL